MGKVKSVWSCKECGGRQVKWSGSCPVCKEWNTLEQEADLSHSTARFEAARVGAQPLRMCEIEKSDRGRLKTGLVEMDRLLGGGIVKGSLILLGGDPGVGKSTLMLQLSQSLAQQGLTVLYVCGEESVEQTSLRAERLGIESDRLYLFSETQYSHIKLQVDRLKPDILVIDSIQIVYKSEIPSAPGSVTQVREMAAEFMHLSKGSGISTFLIGHVTKSGEIAGPRVLEHIVDTVLDFEGDRQVGYRILRAVKNRFGPTDDIVLFQMHEGGLREISNPSVIFLEERSQEASGSVILPTLEGSRSLLVEVQALVAPTAFATSSRRSAGIDPNRLALMLAVLEKRVGYQLHRFDVFVSVAGGLKIVEPASDLAVILAISSSFTNVPIDANTIVLGEVGLGGEVRGIQRLESRLKEAIHLGFKSCILPNRSLKNLSLDIQDKMAFMGVDFVEEALDASVR
ncbi:MAG: DNA repair protein RadA [Chlamydiae bacterium GWC2_50_10]|nr:MAG: DNA repair protein RadA [Chlamydiae bacterium GWC2_50_10]OGN55134.1 MAG: DNA repair protein RadA [Chlamydiae bacterium GWF2_49_8]OGN57984.1 MAG: DNA repair protein RadA [Chlamydiae bacterium RIFCSPHIGHO2_02_FULL_49_29]OGN63188.1 MAG: DNA repair protein RadA [Chlamydiae bacterium RIFCSPHIGHO2_12_FULL_49_32]OGN67620.1 MAG: DNA repair protein RadA [Chlamydiae bacterium RIFCSPLOWO2_02_FULL_49_12]OGN70929.1 MAG: DNA repair protein RadA [Chlamydiae bacterium RIFCSPLOWO2_12_FULL_49_12]HAZ157